MHKKVDRRVNKTKRAVYGAFGALMQEKRYSQISVQDIIDRADVGRTTFYAHFPTKDDLLAEFIHHIFESLLEENAPEPKSAGEIIPAKKLFAHLQGHGSWMKGILLPDTGGVLFEQAVAYWTKRIESFLTAQGENQGKLALPLPLQINQIAHSMAGLIQWWVQNNMPYSPQEMEGYWNEILFAMV